MRNEEIQVINDQNLQRAKHKYLNYNMQKEVEMQQREFDGMMEAMQIAKEIQEKGISPEEMSVSGENEGQTQTGKPG